MKSSLFAYFAVSSLSPLSHCDNITHVRVHVGSISHDNKSPGGAAYSIPAISGLVLDIPWASSQTGKWWHHIVSWLSLMSPSRSDIDPSDCIYVCLNSSSPFSPFLNSTTAESLTNHNEAELQRRCQERQQEIDHMQQVLETKIQLLQEVRPLQTYLLKTLNWYTTNMRWQICICQHSMSTKLIKLHETDKQVPQMYKS